MSAIRRPRLLLLPLLLAACDLAPEHADQQGAALTTAQTTVLGFESLSAWSSPTGATLSLSSTHTQGKSSLQVKPNGFTDLRSINLASLGAGPVRTFSVDVKTPSPPVNPDYFGEVQLYLNMPSKNVSDRYLGRHDLKEVTPGQFGTLTFQVPDDTATLLGGTYSDLQIKITMISPAGSTPYLFDNLRVNGKPLDTPVLATCPAYARIQPNGDVRFELTTPTRRALVEVVFKKGSSTITRTITTSEQKLANGTYQYSDTEAASGFTRGTALAVRFRSRTTSTGADIFTPGPTATTFTPSFSYDPALLCLPVRDTDADGTPDSADHCPNDSKKNDPGFCGCGVPDKDSDSDGVPDCQDECPTDPARYVAGDCGCAGAPAKAGTVCVDGACPGRLKCNGQGVCGDPNACIPPGASALPITFRWQNSIYMIVPGSAKSWADLETNPPPGYHRLQLGSELENRVLTARIKRHLGSTARAWTSAKVTSKGVIASFEKAAGPGVDIWKESTKNVDHAYLNFASGEPKAGLTSGCVSLAADGLWRVETCTTARFAIYERSALSLAPRTDPPQVTCADFPGVICRPQDGFDDESCVPEGQELPADGGVMADQSKACIDCQQAGTADCSAACAGIAKLPPAGSTCADEQPAASFCQVAAGGPTCTSNADCTQPDQVCGVVSGGPACPSDDPNALCHPQSSVPERHCGVPLSPECMADRECDILAPGCRRQDGAKHACSEARVCTVPNPVGDPAPVATAGHDLGSTVFDPAKVFTPAPEPTPTPFPDDAPTGSGPERSWCKYKPTKLDEQKAADTKEGGAGNGSFVSVKFDPNVTLDFDMDPLAQGEVNMKLDASAQFKAQARFELLGKGGTIDIVDALAAARADRCRFWTTDSKLEVFGTDFLPKFAKDLLVDTAEGSGKTAHDKCEAALKGFEEVANRAKKALRDAQELLRQYHEGLKLGRCFDALKLCNDLLAQAPEGFPKLDCKVVTPEDVVNLFIYHYERQLNADIPFPELPGLSDFSLPDSTNPRFPDFRLPNPRFPSLPSTSFNGAALPDLEGAQNALGEIAPAQGLGKNFNMGCGNDAHTERQSLLAVQFALGPIPMLLELEGVLKYGIGGAMKFQLNPGNAVLGGEQKQLLASVTAQAEPCASAGVALFVGAGFSGFGLKAAAGVEGEVNLVTLSMPAYASARLLAAKEKVDLLDSLASNTGGAPKPVRLVAKELRGLWSGETFPLHRYRFYLGYDYGADVEAKEILKGKLSATLTVKFWFFKKRWRTTLVNFKNGAEFKKNLIHGGDDAAATGEFPWGTLEMPSPFVKLMHLKRGTSKFAGLSFPQLADLGLDASGLSVPQLGRLDLDLPELGAISIPATDLDALSVALKLPDLKSRLTGAGLDLNALHLSDFAKIGLTLPDFAGWTLTHDQVGSLGLDLSDLVKLGLDLSSLKLPSVSPSCNLDVALDRVEEFFYDHACTCKPAFDATKPFAHGEQRCFNSADCCDTGTSCGPKAGVPYHVCAPLTGVDVTDVLSAGKAVTTTGDVLEKEIFKPFARSIKSFKVTLVSGNLDDEGFVVDPTNTPHQVGSASVCHSSIGAITTPVDITPFVKLFGEDRNALTFVMRAVDLCGTNVGWDQLRVRYEVQFE